MGNIEELLDFYGDKPEYIEYLDDFMKEYQQKKGGYIDCAICQCENSRNQKWHFTNYLKFLKNKQKPFSYGRIFCPELLLWIAKASGISEGIIDQAKEEAMGIIGKEGLERSRMKVATAIRNKIPWIDIEAQIIEQRRNND